LQDKGGKYVLKLGPKGRMMRNEIKALKAIKDKETIDKFRYPYDYIPEVIDHGDFLFHNG